VRLDGEQPGSSRRRSRPRAVIPALVSPLPPVAIDDGERAGLARRSHQLEAPPWAGVIEMSDAAALLAMLLRLGKKAEQECYGKPAERSM